MNYPWHHQLQLKLHVAKQTDRLPHALLFSAAQGCGHDAFVLDFTQSLLCLEPDDSGIACGHCRSCGVYQAAAHPDFIHVKTPADKHIISVDQIRALNHFLELSRSYSPVRVAIISDAEVMNVNAANSLLKTLEEPSANTHIILFSHQSNKLLPTIRSRCQQIRMPAPPKAEALGWLETQKLTQSPSALLDLAAGKPIEALLLDNGELIEKHTVWLSQLLDLLQNKSAIAAIAADWSKQDKHALLNWQIGLVQQILHLKITENHDVALGRSEEATSVISHLKNNDLWALNDGLLDLKSLSAHPLNPQLFAENMLSLWLK